MDVKDRLPPCWPAGQPCPNNCAADLHARLATNHVYLTQQWQDWRLAGRDLVSPDGDRINPQRLRGLLWREAAEARLAKLAAKRTAKQQVRHGDVKVLVVPNEDWHRRHFGTSAG